jgi:peptidyl-prolyl cis-trans isomerase B (cyclophilin B)
VDQLLAQAESDLKWWSEHGYKEPMPAADRVVVLRTELGDIHLQFFADLAPRRTEQFLTLCQIGAYNGTMFHFVRGGNAVPASVVAGDPYSFFYNDPLKKEHILRWGRGGVGSDLPPEEARFRVNHQRTIVTSHRQDQADWDNGIQFEILLDTERDFDRINTPFAKVVEGMSVVEAIAKRKTASDHEPYQQGLDFSTAAARDLLVEPVVIYKAVAYQDGKALEHSFGLTESEKQLSGLKDAPAEALPADEIHGGRQLRPSDAEGDPRFGLDYPFPADVDSAKADPTGERS